MGLFDTTPSLADFFSGKSSFFQDMLANSTHWRKDPCPDKSYPAKYGEFAETILDEQYGGTFVVSRTPVIAWDFLRGLAYRIQRGQMEGPAKSVKVFSLDYALLRVGSTHWTDYLRKGSGRPLVFVHRLDLLGPLEEWDNGMAGTLISSLYDDVAERRDQRAPILVGTADRRVVDEIVEHTANHLARRIRVLDIDE